MGSRMREPKWLLCPQRPVTSLGLGESWMMTSGYGSLVSARLRVGRTCSRGSGRELQTVSMVPYP